MIRKARNNLDAALILSGWKDADSAVSRLYYALYHAGWYFLMRQQVQVPIQQDGSRYFRHKDMIGLLESSGFGSGRRVRPGWDEEWDHIRNLRVKADYYPDSVDMGDLEDELFAFATCVIEEVSR
jgi:hypothetical protein